MASSINFFFKKVYLEKVKGHNMSVTCETKKSF